MALVIKSVVTVGAGSHPGKCHELSPLEWFTHHFKIFADRTIVLFGVQSPVFTYCVLQHEIEYLSKHKPMDVDVVFDYREDCIEPFVQRNVVDRCEQRFGFFHIATS